MSILELVTLRNFQSEIAPGGKNIWALSFFLPPFAIAWAVLCFPPP